MALSLEIVDNQNGTGATATIAGSPAGATNQVFVSRVTGILDSAQWVPAGSRLGNGSLALGLASGIYWGYCASDGIVIANLAYFSVTANDSVLFRCLEATQARIRALALIDLPSANVLVRKVASDRDVGPGKAFAWPSVQISPVYDEVTASAGGTNWRDDVVYSVQVAILAIDNQDQTSNFSKYLRWRQQIARAFRHQPLPGVSEVITCESAPGQILSADAFLRQNLFSSVLLLRFYAREPRGFAS